MADRLRHVGERRVRGIHRRHEQLVVRTVKRQHARLHRQLAGDELQRVGLELVEVIVVHQRKAEPLMKEIEQGILGHQATFEQRLDQRIARRGRSHLGVR